MSKLPQINISQKHERIIALVDMDCFYCQVEEKLNPELEGRPIAVVQYNAWKGGGIIAVNYPARKLGVTRHMRGDEAKEHCPDIELVQVPSIRDKADLSKYRDAGKEVAMVLQSFTTQLERASVDEAYLDITASVSTRLKEMNKGDFDLQPDKLINTYAVGYPTVGDFIQTISTTINDIIDQDEREVDEELISRKNNLKLLIGASILTEIRRTVKEKTGFECSTGIAHNKILAKLVCGMNKPNKQTILPIKNLDKLYSNLSVKKIRGLGAKFGDDVCQTLNIKLMSELNRFSRDELQSKFDEKNGLWLYNIARGIDLEAVIPRYTSKSIGCCKKFPGRAAIRGVLTLRHWLRDLADEINGRLQTDETENNRRPRQLVISYQQIIHGEDVSSSRSVSINGFDVEQIPGEAESVIKRNTDRFLSPDNENTLNNRITFLGLSVGKFESIDISKRNTIQDMFNKAKEKKEIKDSVMKNDIVEQPVKQVEEMEVPISNSKCFLQISNKVELQNFNDSQTTLITDKEVINPENEDSSKYYIENSLITNKLEDTLQLMVDKNKNEMEYEIGESSTYEQSIDANNTDYRHTYAEYQRPNKEFLSDFYQECEQCKKTVLTIDMQSHNDAHLAYKISQEQRIEFRSTIKSKLTPTTKRLKIEPTKSKRQKTVNKSSNFLFKFLERTDSTKNNNNSESEECPQCGKSVLISDMLEHSDYHAAKLLQIELNRNTIPTDISETGSIHGSILTNKMPASKSSKNKTNNNKSIADFFKVK